MSASRGTFWSGLGKGVLHGGIASALAVGIFSVFKAASTVGLYTAAKMTAGGIFAAGQAAAAVFLTGISMGWAIIAIAALAYGLYSGIDTHLDAKDYDREMALVEKLAAGSEPKKSPAMEHNLPELSQQQDSAPLSRIQSYETAASRLSPHHAPQEPPDSAVERLARQRRELIQQRISSPLQR